MQVAILNHVCKLLVISARNCCDSAGICVHTREIAAEVACVNEICYIFLFLYSKQWQVNKRCTAIRAPQSLNTTVWEYTLTVTACCMSSNRISLWIVLLNGILTFIVSQDL